MKRRAINISTERLPTEVGARELRTLEVNLEDDLKHFGGHLPHRSVIAWHAFLSAMLEWRILVFAEYRRIAASLPAYPADPVDRTLMGRAISYQHSLGEVTSAELEALASRIRADVGATAGLLPDSLSVAWHAYISPLQVYGVINLSQYESLRALLPKLEGKDPIDPIVLGRD